jgi:mannose-6-phosphate isomerase-like protein (cupin superfamily)
MTLQSSNLENHIFSAGENLDWFQPLPGEQIAMRIESHQSNGAFSLTEVIVAPQAGPPLHIHQDADEVLYVLEGTVDFVCNGECFRTGPGGFAAIPRGAAHAFRNFENGPARMIVLLTPGGFEQFMPAMKGNPTSDIPALAARFGMQIVGSQIDRATVSQQQIA